MTRFMESFELTLHLINKFSKLINYLFILTWKTLQDFTVLLTEKFRRCVIRSSSVIFLLTSLPMDYFRRLFFCR
jgi:hypothetical protein